MFLFFAESTESFKEDARSWDEKDDDEEKLVSLSGGGLTEGCSKYTQVKVALVFNIQIFETLDTSAHLLLQLSLHSYQQLVAEQNEAGMSSFVFTQGN